MSPRGLLPEALMALADRAMYAVKAQRRTAPGIYTPDIAGPPASPSGATRSPSRLPPGTFVALRQDHQVVAVDDLLGDLGGSSEVRRPAHSESALAVWRTRPLAKTSPSGPVTATASPALNSPCTSRTPGRQQRDALGHEGFLGTGVHDDGPRWGEGKGDPELSGGQARKAGLDDRADPGRARQRVPQHVGPLGRGDHDPDARPGCDLRGRQLGGHTSAPPVRARAAGQGEHLVDLTHLFDERSLLVEARVRREQAGRIGEQHQQVGLEQVRHEGGQPVVVAEADFVVGDGVVLVDDRDYTEVEQDAERLTRCRYWARCMKSRGASSTWPPMSPTASSARS